MSINSENPRRYNWETWPGKNIPLCQGRCLFGPDLGVWICNISIITICSVLFYIFVANRIHPATIVCGVFLDILTLICLMYATFTEPGIIPRAYHPLGQPRPPPQTQLINGVHIPLKYCDTCHIYRPPRAKHCRDCDCCIEEFDHHCPWVCNCVGRRNYRFFVAFVCSVCILDIYVFFLSGYLIIREAMSSTFSESVSSNPIAAALTAITLMLGCCLGSLAGYHCSLIAEQMTTNEHIKRSRAHDHEDESQDIQQQHITFTEAMKRTCCTPIPTSRIDLRGLTIPISIGASSSTLHESSIHTTIPVTSQATSAPIALPLDNDDIHETSRDRMVHDVHEMV